MKIFIIVIAVICALLLVAFGIGAAFVRMLIKRDDDPESPEKGDELDPLFEPTGAELWTHNIPLFEPFRQLPFEETEIISKDGLTLKADILRGKPDTDVTVMFCHGYKSEPALDFATMYDFYREKGYNLMYIHMRGHGKSEGKYVGFGVLDRFDIPLWAEKAVGLFPDTSIFMHGMSMGAASIMQSADLKMPSQVRGIIADCGFSNLNEIFRNLVGGEYHLPATPFVDFFEWANRIIAGYGFSESDSVKSMQNSRLPLLYICGDSDKFVPLDMAMRIFNACTQDKQLLISEGAGHAASFLLENEKYTQLVTGFIESHKGVISYE